MTARTNTTMTIRTNKDIKNEAKDIYAALGIDLTTAINVFLRQSIRYRGFPFAVTLERPNEITAAAIEDALNDKEMHGPFDSIDEMMEELNA